MPMSVADGNFAWPSYVQVLASVCDASCAAQQERVTSSSCAWLCAGSWFWSRGELPSLILVYLHFTSLEN